MDRRLATSLQSQRENNPSYQDEFQEVGDGGVVGLTHLSIHPSMHAVLCQSAPCVEQQAGGWVRHVHHVQQQQQWRTSAACLCRATAGSPYLLNVHIEFVPRCRPFVVVLYYGAVLVMMIVVSITWLVLYCRCCDCCGRLHLLQALGNYGVVMRWRID